MILSTSLLGDVVFECVDGECEADAEFQFQGRRVTASLWLDDIEQDLDALKQGLATLGDLDELDRTARRTFGNQLEQPGRSPTRDYVDEHREHLAPNMLLDVLQVSSESDASPHAIIAALYLHHARVHAGGGSARITLDYVLSKTHSDSLLVLELDQTGRLLRITTES